MTISARPIDIAVGERIVAGTLIAPLPVMPGLMFIHGWAGTQAQYTIRARRLAALGCICLTFDLHGHARTDAWQPFVTRADNLRDVIAAYDRLATLPNVDRDAIGVIGSSYGGYLAAILSESRPIRWLGLRVPALYKDEDWTVPKRDIDREEIARYRRAPVPVKANRALRACARFRGDALIVQCEHDDLVPPAAIASYRAAFHNARSLTYRVIGDADHALSTPEAQAAYTSLLVKWAHEMGIGAPSAGAPSADTADQAMAPVLSPPG